MNCVFPILYVTLLLHSVLGSLRAPVNVTVCSRNFHHVLRWDPGPGTPPGTLYNVYKRVAKIELLNSTKKTSLELLLDINEECYLTVEAYYNQTVSAKSRKVFFTPFTDTIIGPAELSLVGCGNCIQINISLPQPDQRSGVEDLQKFYDPEFIVRWRKKKEAVSGAKEVKTQSKSCTLDNLETREEYCVQVDTKIRTNKNTQPSNWKCILTSPVEDRRDPAVLGAVAAIVIVVMGVLMSSMFCFYYTGFLCKLQATLPRALITALSQGYMLTPEKTIPDLISVTSEMEQRTQNNPTTSPPATRNTSLEKEQEEEEYEEEEEGINVYMSRNAELYSSECSCSVTSISENYKPAASGNSVSLTERFSTQVEAPAVVFVVGVVQRWLDHDDTRPEGTTVSFINEKDQTAIQGYMTGEQEDEEINKKVEECDSSGNVNLFSVTLAALAVEEKEEENTRDSLKLSNSDLDLLPTVSKLTLSNTDFQKIESDNQLTGTLICLTHEDSAETGYENRHAHTQEEEELSGYMAHT